VPKYVNGFELNDVDEAANWSPREVALLTAFAELLPPAGTNVVTDEHMHTHGVTIGTHPKAKSETEFEDSAILEDTTSIRIVAPGTKHIDMVTTAGAINITATCGNVNITSDADNSIVIDSGKYVDITGDDRVLLTNAGNTIEMATSTGIKIESDINILIKTTTDSNGDIDLEAADDVKIYAIGSSSNMTLSSTGGITLTAGGNLNLRPGNDGTGDAYLSFGDNAGANKFAIKDSDAAEVFSVDSNGNVDAVDFASTSFADITSSCALTGWSAVSGKVLAKKIGKTAFVQWQLVGNSDATTCSIELPAGFRHATIDSWGLYKIIFTVDNSVEGVGVAAISSNSLVINMYHGLEFAAWTSTGSKTVYGEIFFECAA